MSDKTTATVKEINDKFREAFNFAAENGCKVKFVSFEYNENVKGDIQLNSIGIDYKSR